MNELASHRRRGRLIVFLDETVFSKKALKLVEYSARNTSLSVEQEDIYTGYKCVIASMTEDRGMGLCQTHDKAIN